MTRRTLLILCASLAATACLEPNQSNLGGDGGGPDGDDAGTDGGPGEPGVDDDDGDPDDDDGVGPDGGSGGEETDGDESGGPSVTCGDGVVDDGEVCDDGVNDGGYGGCAADCQRFGPYCGDAEYQPAYGEGCDDGNDADGDGCNIDCLESGRLLWDAVYDDGLDEELGESVDIGEDGTVLVLGQRHEFEPERAIRTWLGWYDSDGDLVHTTDSRDTVESGRAAWLLPDDAYVVRWGVGLFDDAVRRYDGTDTLTWERQYDQADVDVDYELDAIYVSGADQGVGFYEKRDGSSGALDFDGTPGASACSDLGVIPGGGMVFRCDELRGISANNGELFTVEVEGAISSISALADGTFAASNTQGVRAYDALGTSRWHFPMENNIWGVAASPDGSVVALTNNDDDVVLTKVGPDGTAQWTRSYDEFDRQQARDIDIGPDGTIAISGWVTDDGSDLDIFVATFAP